MLIRKCIASLPGLFQNRSLEFDEGLTIVVGKNASGKSLLSRILSDMAWCNFSTPSMVRNNVWENAYLEMEVENNDHRYQLIRNGMKRVSVRHFYREMMNVLFEGTLADEVTDDPRSIIIKNIESLAGDTSLHDIYSQIDIGTFGTVSFVVAPVDAAQNGLPDYNTFRRLFCDDASRFYHLYRSLKNYYTHETREENAGSTVNDTFLSLERQLRDAERSIQMLDIQKSKKLKLVRELEHTDEEIRSLNQEAEEINREKADITAVLKKIEAVSAAGEKIGEIDAELHRYDELLETVNRKEREIAEKFSQFADFNEHKKANLRRLQEIYRKIRDIHASLDDISFSKNLRKRKAHYISFFVFIIFLGTMYLLNISRVPGLDSQTQFIVNSVLMGSTAFIEALLYLSLLFPRMKKEKERLFTSQNEAHSELHAILHENGISLEDNRLESVYEFLLQYFEEYGEYTEKQLELFVLRETLKSAEQLKTLTDEKKSYSLDLRKLNVEIQNCIKSLKHLEVPSADEEEIRHQIIHADSLLEHNREKIDDRNRIKKQLVEEIKAAGDYIEEYEELDSRKKRLNQKLKIMTAHKNAVLYIIDTAERVVEQRESRQLDRLFSSTRKIFNQITSNQYITIVDEPAIKKIMAGENIGHEINSSIMHVIMMSIKIAFSEFLSGIGVSIPMILDDPFLLLDETRGKILLNTLKATGQKRQVVVFTRHNTYLDTERYLEL